MSASIKAEARATIRASLLGAIAEAQSAALARWVIALDDTTPLRIEGDRVGLQGASILTVESRARGASIAGYLNERYIAAGLSCRAGVSTAESWRTERIEAVRELLRIVEEA